MCGSDTAGGADALGNFEARQRHPQLPRCEEVADKFQQKEIGRRGGVKSCTWHPMCPDQATAAVGANIAEVRCTNSGDKSNKNTL